MMMPFSLVELKSTFLLSNIALPILWFSVLASRVAFGSGAQSTSFKSYGFHKSESKTSGGENSAFDGANVKEYKEPWEENPEASAFFMKLPPVIPMIKKVQDVKENVKRPGGPRGAAKLVRLNELPTGFIGKMIVYKSGKVKLKLGDTLYDVSSGMNCIFSQELVAMNATEKHCCTIGEINALATVTPDIDAALDCLSDLDL